MRIFRYWKFENDMKDTNGFEDAARIWAKDLDGEVVYEISNYTGICKGMLVHFDWTEEVQSYGE